jgi:SAM-dependent methyltransferase
MPNPNREIDKTHLSIDQAEERCFIHRDYIAHCLRWSHVVKFLNQQKRYQTAAILDVGCGKEMPLIKTLYTSKMSPKRYCGVDANRIDIGKIQEKIGEKMDTGFLVCDQTDFSQKRAIDFDGEQFNVVTCFEVLEHVTPEKVIGILDNIKFYTTDDADIFISTPVFNGKAAANHINEMTYDELDFILRDAGFNIIDVWGTFASQRDIEPQIVDFCPSPSGDECVAEMYGLLKEYYDSNLLSIIFAPLFPKQSRNCLWHIRKTPLV